MGRREARKLTRRLKAQGAGLKVEDGRQLFACGRISNGISETYIPFRAMPSADEICSMAIRKVIRSLKEEAPE